MTFDLTDFLKGLAAASQQTKARAVAAVDAFGEHTLGDAQELCPVETGALKASATAKPARLVSDGVEKQIGFNTDYAAARHERMPEEDAPPTVQPGGRWKYLTTALQRNAPKFGPFIADRIRL